MGASVQAASMVAEKVEKRVYDGIPSRQILRLIFTFMRRHKPNIKHVLDLRTGLSLMNPKPEFEMFVRKVLAESGFEVEPNRILRGKCGEHEVDAIAKKNGVTFFVEAKHHFSYHALTGLDESRIAQAVLEDVNDGFLLGTVNVKIDRAMIVTNTRYSEHAVEYGTCKNILQIGWSSPQAFGLKDVILKNKLYPISCLRGVPEETRMRLVNAGMVLVKQLLKVDATELARKTGLPKEAAWEIIGKARVGAGAFW
jgi:Holliday junction resolvase-like predicted endonuclease